MSFHRREFLITTASAFTLAALASEQAAAMIAKPGIKVIAFDAFPIFDPRPIFALVEKLFPDEGAELSNVWRTRQFEYTWLSTAAHHYQDFWTLTESALVYAAKSRRLELTEEKRKQLMAAYLELGAWPDVVPALNTLKEQGIRLALLSNFTPTMLDAAIKSSGLQGMFDQVLSTDKVKSYKPDPRAYQMGIDAFRLRREEILFAPFAAWDAAGAKQFGYPTFWVNRQNQLPEELGVTADRMGSNLRDLVEFVAQK